MLPPPLTVEIRHQDCVGEARRAGRSVAEAIGFAPESCEEIALTMTELATNLIKYARGGTLTLTPLAEGGRVGLEIRSHDEGPGIADVEQALGDRYSISGTRGTGLGAVNRMMDELDIASRRGAGTDIVCRKWLRRHRVSLRPCPLSFGVASRPRALGKVNGDAFVVHKWEESVLVGVIDGLGHGQFAHRAAETARQYVEAHFDLPLDQIFRGTGRACRATRGIVMALARFDWGEGRIAFASVGNIMVRIFPNSKPFRFTVRRGVVGLNAPNAVVAEQAWPLDDMLVLHSDGVSVHWDWNDFPDFTDRPAGEMAKVLLRERGREEDDATVVVVRSVIP